jgi:hypothetical protein
MLQCAPSNGRPTGRRHRLSNVVAFVRWLAKITGIRPSQKPKPPPSA